MPCCVNPDHLFIGTIADNNADMHAKKRGVTPRGEANGGAKLTAEQVIAIRADRRTLREIAADYGIAAMTAYKIKTRIKWTHI